MLRPQWYLWLPSYLQSVFTTTKTLKRKSVKASSEASRVWKQGFIWDAVDSALLSMHSLYKDCVSRSEWRATKSILLHTSYLETTIAVTCNQWPKNIFDTGRGQSEPGPAIKIWRHSVTASTPVLGPINHYLRVNWFPLVSSVPTKPKGLVTSDWGQNYTTWNANHCRKAVASSAFSHSKLHRVKQ